MTDLKDKIHSEDLEEINADVENKEDSFQNIETLWKGCSNIQHHSVKKTLWFTILPFSRILYKMMT